MNIGQLLKDFVISFERIELHDKAGLSSQLIRFCVERGYALSSTTAEMELDRFLEQGHPNIKRATELSTIELSQFHLSNIDAETLKQLFIIGGNDVPGISRGDGQEPENPM